MLWPALRMGFVLSELIHLQREANHCRQEKKKNNKEIQHQNPYTIYSTWIKMWRKRGPTIENRPTTLFCFQESSICSLLGAGRWTLAASQPDILSHQLCSMYLASLPWCEGITSVLQQQASQGGPYQVSNSLEKQDWWNCTLCNLRKTQSLLILSLPSGKEIRVKKAKQIITESISLPWPAELKAMHAFTGLVCSEGGRRFQVCSIYRVTQSRLLHPSLHSTGLPSLLLRFPHCLLWDGEDSTASSFLFSMGCQHHDIAVILLFFFFSIFWVISSSSLEDI